MHRYACLICLFAFCSNAHANLNVEDSVNNESVDEVTAVVRIAPETEMDLSEFFETAPEEAMIEDFQVAGDLSKKHNDKKQVRCISSQGGASYYWQPQKTASGGRLNPEAMTAAHKTLPFGHQVRVTNIRTGKSVVVTINDRGPYTKGRIIDLSRGSFKKIAPLGQGVAQVKIESVGCD